jgi:hypothetical protein
VLSCVASKYLPLSWGAETMWDAMQRRCRCRLRNLPTAAIQPLPQLSHTCRSPRVGKGIDFLEARRYLLSAACATDSSKPMADSCDTMRSSSDDKRKHSSRACNYRSEHTSVYFLKSCAHHLNISELYFQSDSCDANTEATRYQLVEVPFRERGTDFAN